MAKSNHKGAEQELLCCLSLDGAKRYDLPAYFAGHYQNYAIYRRPHPRIIHFIKNQIFELPHQELVLVSTNEYHVISIALAKDLKPLNMYVNINLIPKKYDNGYTWQDLELDIKITKSYDGYFSAYIVDMEQYENAVISDEHRLLCEREISKIIERTILRKFPFEPQFLEPFLQKFWLS